MNEKVKKPHEFLATEIKVYPTDKPDQAKEIPTPPQTVKIKAIRRSQLERK